MSVHGSKSHTRVRCCGFWSLQSSLFSLLSLFCFYFLLSVSSSSSFLGVRWSRPARYCGRSSGRPKRGIWSVHLFHGMEGQIVNRRKGKKPRKQGSPGRSDMRLQKKKMDRHEGNRLEQLAEGGLAHGPSRSVHLDWRATEARSQLCQSPRKRGSRTPCDEGRRRIWGVYHDPG